MNEYSLDNDENNNSEFKKVINILDEKDYIKAILEAINKIRNSYEKESVYEDIYFSYLAKDYAEFLINNEHDFNNFEALAINRKIQKKFYSNSKLIFTKYQVDEEFEFNEESLIDIINQSTNSLLESNNDLNIILDKNVNSIGLNLYIDSETICICLIFNKRKLIFESITCDDKNDITMKIRNFSKWGLRFIKISDYNTEKEIKIIGPECINYNKETNIFTVNTSLSDHIDRIKLLFDFALYQNISEIKYGKQEKINYLSGFNNGDHENRILGIIYPRNLDVFVLNTKVYNVDINKVDEQDYFRNKNYSKESEDDENEENDELSEAELSKEPSEEDEDEEEDESNNYEENENEENEDLIKKENLFNNKEILEELKNAISEAKSQRDNQLNKNQILQEKILYFKKENNINNEKTGDVTMSDIKYSNTLAHVHQIKQELDNTSKKYSEMAEELNNKLEEKTNKSNEIKLNFMELKRNVSQKAIFLKTLKPIMEDKIKEMEEVEDDKAKQLHKLRLGILKSRTILNKNSKQIKKKEELAEGLHLIDFEQLKIENQSLNEKIEDRNEDLHKLKKKNTTTIQILTHTIEKLNFETKKLNENNLIKNDLKEKYQLLKDEVRNLKLQKEEFRKEKIILSQETGILNSKTLKTDFNDRIENIKNLMNEKNKLDKRLEEMTDLINLYNNKKLVN